MGRVSHSGSPPDVAPPVTQQGRRRRRGLAIAGLLLCVVSMMLTPYTRLPFAVGTCAALLAGDLLLSSRGRRSRLGRGGRRWLVTQPLLLALAGAIFIPIPKTRPSLYVVLAATAVAAAVFAVTPAEAIDAERY